MNVLIVVGSLNIRSIVDFQEHVWLVVPFFPLFLLLFISTLAETTRPPFDLTEAEGELVAGFNVEYSSTPFALFFMGEYLNILAMSTLITIVFLGGHNIGYFGCASCQDHFFSLMSYLYQVVIDSCNTRDVFTKIYIIKTQSYFSYIYLPIYSTYFSVTGMLIRVCTVYTNLVYPHLHLLYTISSTLVFVSKINLVVFFFLWVRASVPRYRYDLLLRLTWKVFLPISFGYLILTTGVCFLFDGLPPS